MQRMQIRLVVVSRDAATCTCDYCLSVLNISKLLTGPSLKAFPETLDEGQEAKQIEHLINVRNSLRDWSSMAAPWKSQSFISPKPLLDLMTPTTVESFASI